MQAEEIFALGPGLTTLESYEPTSWYKPRAFQTPHQENTLLKLVEQDFATAKAYLIADPIQAVVTS